MILEGWYRHPAKEVNPETSEPLNEDWGLLVSFLPPNWEDLARQTGALRKLRKHKSPGNLLRTLLLHLGCGHSLRETVVRARRADLADLSDVALLKRLRKSRDWLQALCVELFREQGLAATTAADSGEVRAFDATTVSEPGRTGSLWRIHYSVRLPSLTCDFFKLTRTEGAGTGESLKQFPIAAGDCILADRGYSTGRGIQYVAEAGGQVTVRVNSGSLLLEKEDGTALDLVDCLRPLHSPGIIGSVAARALASEGAPVAGRVCGLRKSEEAVRLAQAKIRKEASRKGRTVQPHAGTGQVRHSVHHRAGKRVVGRRRAGVVSHALAGGIDVQAIQVAGPAGLPAEVRRRQREGVAVRQAAGCAAGRETDPPRERHFPLGVRSGTGIAHAAPGVTSNSFGTRCNERSSRRFRCRRHSLTGRRFRRN